MISIEVRLFGAFRKYESRVGPMLIRVDDPIRVTALKSLIDAHFKNLVPGFSDSQLIEDSAIADESQVLAYDQVLNDSCTVLMFPPVSGG